MTDTKVLYTGPLVTRPEATRAGLIRYFTGKPCKYGHVDERRVDNKCCMQCCRIKTNPNSEHGLRRKGEDAANHRREKARLDTQLWRDRLTKEKRSEMTEAARERNRRLYKTDIQYTLRNVLRARFHVAIKNGQKEGSAIRDLGCSIDELKIYLERLWTPGMSWENWGIGAGKWQIDHVRDLVLFDLSDPAQVKIACHYTNLQPMWQRENIAKGWDARKAKAADTVVMPLLAGD